MDKGKLFSIFTAVLLILTASANARAEKKKLFINRFETGKGVSSSLTEKIRDYMILSVLENYKDTYTTITDEDIKIMYKKASDLMGAGCSADKCVKQIGDAIDADEIIYGKVSKEGGKISVSMKNLERNRETLSISTKSFVKISFFESRLEWFSKETAKKLIRPGYRIDRSRAPSVVAGGFKVEKIDLKKSKGLDISALKFESKDEEITKYIDFFKELVEKGDSAFKNENYDEAMGHYKETLSRIENKLSAEKQKKVSSFSEDVEKRIAAVHEQKLKIKLNDIDEELSGSGDLDMEDLRSGEAQYKKLLESALSSYNKLKERYKRWLKNPEEAIRGRLKSVYTAMAELKEEEGDSWYGEYKFRRAIESYRKGISITKECEKPGSGLKKIRQRLDDKVSTTMTTGTSWLENKMWSYCDQAEFLNVRNRLSEAQDVMEKAGYMLSAHEEFLTPEIEKKYEKTCELVNYDRSEVQSDVAMLEETSGTFYLTGTIISWGLTAGFFGTGYLFETKVASANDDYDSFKKKYDSATTISEASRLHKEMESAHDDAEKNALYRNISYGIGAAAFAGAVYFTYKYIVYKSVESRLNRQISRDILFTPVYAGAPLPGGCAKKRDHNYYYGAMVMFRL